MSIKTTAPAPEEKSGNPLTLAMLTMITIFIATITIGSILFMVSYLNAPNKTNSPEFRSSLFSHIESKAELSGYTLHPGVGKEALITSCLKESTSTIDLISLKDTGKSSKALVVCTVDVNTNAIAVTITPQI